MTCLQTGHKFWFKVIIYMEESNIVEKFEFNTSILTSYDGHEQRIKTRQYPRHYVSYKYDASQYLNNDSVKYNAVHDNFLYRNVIKTPKPKSDDNDHNHSSSSFGGSSFSGSVSSHSGGRSGGSF